MSRQKLYVGIVVCILAAFVLVCIDVICVGHDLNWVLWVVVSLQHKCSIVWVRRRILRNASFKLMLHGCGISTCCVDFASLYVVCDELHDCAWNAPNDTAYKRWSCHSGHKLLCKWCQTSLPQQWGPIYRFWASQKRVMSRPIQVRQH